MSRVESNEIISLKEAIEEANALLKVVETLDKQGKETAKALKSIAVGQSGKTAKSQIEIAQAVSKSNAERKKALAIDKERAKLQNQLQAYTDEEIKGKLRLQRINATQRKILKDIVILEDKEASVKDKLLAKNRQLIRQRDKLAGETRKEIKEIERLNKEIDENNAKIEKNASALERQKIGIGRYEKAINGLRNVLGQLGVAFGLVAIKNFVLDLNQLAQEAQGVEFAFERLGDKGQDAFERIKASTRGLVSDLDIKKALVNFDNFNISLEETDVLMEFLAVRSAQTGESIDKLKDSLVEGLSKESKLRIDNLGISASELNEELEKTPNFVQAVANIAKREVAEAGSILDEAASGQAKWNAQWENFQLIFAKKIKPVLDSLYEFGANVLSFIGDNLETIISIVSKGAIAFGVYKVAVKSATAVNNLFGKSIIKNVKGFGLWSAAIGLVVNALYEMIVDITNAKDANDLFNDSMAKANELLEQEKDKLQLVGDELLNVNTSNERRQQLIDQINAEYGTTLKNLQDETAFTQQLAEAYDQIIQKLDRKIKLQVIEADLLEETKKLRDLERQLEEVGDIGVFDVLTGSYTGEANLQGQIETSRELIKRFRNELLGLQNEQDQFQKTTAKTTFDVVTNRFVNTQETTSGGGSGDPRIDALNEFMKAQDQALKEYEIKLRQQTEDEEFIAEQLAMKKIELANDTSRKITELGLKDTEVYTDFEVARLRMLKDVSDERVDIELAAIDTIEDAENRLFRTKMENSEKEMENLKELSQVTLDSLSKITEAEQDRVDKQIQASQDQIAKSESEVARLEEIGTAQAIASAEAEKRRIDKENSEIESLEKKKRNLLIVTTGLEYVSSLINQGVTNPFASADKKMSDFIQNLPTAYEGTDMTVAQDRGFSTNTKDGHIYRVHDNEHIVGAKDSDRLHANGIYKTSDIVNSAINWKNWNGQVMNVSNYHDNNALISEVQQMKQAFKSIKFPEQYVYLDRDIIKNGANTKTIDHRKNRI